jgi:hypothetical protein
MDNMNRHGLSRDIPEPVKREVRQRCGFGCINCGNAIYQYEHVEPEFADATYHDPNCIVLLCGACHDRVTRKLLSKASIKSRIKTPKCKEIGFSFGPFDIGSDPPEIVLGTIVARNAKTLIRICGDDVFSIRPPETNGGPFILDARFFNANGRPILDIVANEWRSSSDNWDVEVVGPRITIRKALGNFALILRSEPPRRLVIERMAMAHKGMHIRCEEGKAFQVSTPGGAIFHATDCESDDWRVGIEVDESRIKVGQGGTMRVTANTSIAGGGGLPKLQRLPRNAPCSCGSGLKFKKCHGKDGAP